MSSYELARKLLDSAGSLASSLLSDASTSALSSAVQRASSSLSAESASGLLFIGVFSTFYIGSRYRVSQANRSHSADQQEKNKKKRRRDKSGAYKPPGRLILDDADAENFGTEVDSLPKAQPPISISRFSDMPDVAPLDSTVLSDGLSSYSEEIVDSWLCDGGLLVSDDEVDEWTFKGNSSLSVQVVGWEVADAGDTDGLYLLSYSYTNNTYVAMPSPERAQRGGARATVASAGVEMCSPSDPFGLQGMGGSITSPFKVKRAQEVRCSVKKSYRDLKQFCEQLSFLSPELQFIDYPSLENDVGTQANLLGSIVSTITFNVVMNLLNERMEKRRQAFDKYFVKLSSFFENNGGQDYSLQKLCRFLDREKKFIKL